MRAATLATRPSAAWLLALGLSASCTADEGASSEPPGDYPAQLDIREGDVARSSPCSIALSLLPDGEASGVAIEDPAAPHPADPPAGVGATFLSSGRIDFACSPSPVAPADTAFTTQFCRRALVDLGIREHHPALLDE